MSVVTLVPASPTALPPANPSELSESACSADDQPPPSPPSPRTIAATVAAYYDNENTVKFYSDIWGNENIHIGIYPLPIIYEPRELTVNKSNDTLTVEKTNTPYYTSPTTPTSLIQSYMASVVSPLNDIDKKKFIGVASTACGDAIVDAIVIFLQSHVSSEEPLLVVDLGSGYGETCRKLARRVKSVSTLSLDISQSNITLSDARDQSSGLHLRCSSQVGSFFNISQCVSASVSVVLSQDALLHAGDHREEALYEIHRVMKSGGLLILTDLLQAEDDVLSKAPRAREILTPIYQRLALSSMATEQYYDRVLFSLGYRRFYQDVVENVRNHSSSTSSTSSSTPHNYLYLEHIPSASIQAGIHYATINSLLLSRGPAIGIGTEFVTRMSNGLQNWVLGFEEGIVRWGVLKYIKQ